MASLLFTLLSSLLGAGINGKAFVGASFGFSMLRDDCGKEPKRNDLAEEKHQRGRDDLGEEKHQRGRDQWNEDRMKRLDFINKIVCEKNKARAYINNVDEAILEYSRVFAKHIKPIHLSFSYQIFVIHQKLKKC